MSYFEYSKFVSLLSVSDISYADYALFASLTGAVVKILGDGVLWNKPDPHHYKWFERPQIECGQSLEVVKESRNIGQRLEEYGKDAVIFWGSQSGTAESFAHRLAKDLYQRLKVKSIVLDLDDYDHDTTSCIPESKLAVFIISTYGEGEPSDNALGLFKWFQSSSSTRLPSLRYAAFGLGNSNYRLYNKAVNDLVTALEAKGAEAILSTGRADEARRSTEEDFVEWKSSLIAATASKFGLTECEPEYEPTIRILDCPSQDNNNAFNTALSTPLSSNAGSSILVTAPVKLRQSLTSVDSNSRKTVHLEIDLSNHLEVKYKTGDHILIWPKNPRDEVAQLIEVLSLEARKDSLIAIQPVDSNNKMKLPTRTTVQHLFQNHLEIGAPVKRETLLVLAKYATSTNVKRWLQDLAGDKTAFAEFHAHNHVTFARILAYTRRVDATIDWSILPLSLVIESLPAMSPRYYSISSSSIISPRRVAITVSVKPVALASNPAITISGLASTYLSSMAIPADSQTHGASQLPVQIRRSTFKLPVSSKAPLIMVAAGTGIAPFRAFIQQRARLAAASGIDTVGHMTLFFGCQHPERDYLYKDELEDLQRSTTLNGKLEIVTAFSRVEDETQRRYVQHRVRERGQDVCRMMLEDDTCFYICGAVKMAKEVTEVIAEQMKAVHGWDDGKFGMWRNERKKTKRWHEDVWG